MKLVITGVTGFIGAEILSQALAHADVTQVVSLARREISEDSLPPNSSKLKQLQLPDEASWLEYSPEVLENIKDADAWVWSLGSTSFPDNKTMYTVSVDYTVYAMNTIVRQSSERESPIAVRFVYVSGALVERDQDTSLWFMQDFRLTRGVGENKVIECGRDNGSKITTVAARPAGVIRKDNPLAWLMEMTGYIITVDKVAAWLLETSLRGSATTKAIVENEQMRIEGDALLKRMAE